MFQEKDRMEYSSRKAPDELKNRTWSSIQQEKRRQAKQRRQGLYLAACFAGVLLASNVMYQNSTIVKVNDQPISYFNVSLEIFLLLFLKVETKKSKKKSQWKSM